MGIQPLQALTQEFPAESLVWCAFLKTTKLQTMSMAQTLDTRSRAEMEPQEDDDKVNTCLLSKARAG